MAKIRLIVKVSDIVYMGEKDIDQKERKTELEKRYPGITVQLPRNMVLQCVLEASGERLRAKHLDDYILSEVTDVIKARVGAFPDTFKCEIVGTQVDPSDDLYTPLAGDTPSEMEEYWDGFRDIAYSFNINIFKRDSERIIFPDAAVKAAWVLREYLAEIKNQDIEIYLPEWYDQGDRIIFCGYCTDKFSISDIDVGRILLSLAAGEFKLAGKVDPEKLYDDPEKYIPVRFWNFASSDEDDPLEIEHTLELDPVDLSDFYND